VRLFIENLCGSEAECSRYLRLKSIRSLNHLGLHIYPVFNLPEREAHRLLPLTSWKLLTKDGLIFPLLRTMLDCKRKLFGFWV
jgi:hypothetical protein